MKVLDILTSLIPGPCTAQQLAAALQSPLNSVEAALLQLQRGGYVDRAIPNQGSCSSGCGICSVKNFCPSSQTLTERISPGQGENWRLTDKGLARVRQTTP